jgi:hypothetical protein
MRDWFVAGADDGWGVGRGDVAFVTVLLLFVHVSRA